MPKGSNESSWPVDWEPEAKWSTSGHFGISIGLVSREFYAVQETATKKVLLREKSTKKYPNSTQTSPVVIFFDALSDYRIKKGGRKKWLTMIWNGPDELLKSDL